MNSKALLLTNSLRPACMLGILLFVAMLTINAEALAQSKVTVVYSLEVIDAGAYRQMIVGTPLGAGDADFIFAAGEVEPPGPDGDPNVIVLVDSPLLVTLLFTADSPGGNIVDGPVVLADTHFEREFVIDSGFTEVTTVLSTRLSRRATGILSGSTITWDNEAAVNVYEEDVVGSANCEPAGLFCDLGGDWPRDLTDINEVPLPTFTVLTDTTFGDAFVSDNGTPGGRSADPLDRADDIDRFTPDEGVTVTDTWEGVSLPEPSREILLLAGALGIVGLSRLRERAGASA